MKIDIDNKTFAIGILSLTASAMLLVNLNAPRQAEAAEVVKGRDYQLLTARTSQGDDGLYVVENRTGNMAVFMYDVKAGRIEPRARKTVMEAFSGGAAPILPKGGRQ